MAQFGGSVNGAIAMRRDILSLGTWDESIVWYARAVDDMQKRPKPLEDPTSWVYQARIHGHEPESEKSEFWNQCQHGTSFFLPWHRGYVAAFEQIVRATIVKLGGPDEWALPYWNYSSKTIANARCLPRAFREEKLPSGEDNALFVADRSSKANKGEPVGPETDVSLGALKQPVFEGPGQGGSTGFGGPATGFQHQPGAFGALENRPHNAIHMDVGGQMESPATAALDPIFWLHHSNIDRLWEVWIRQPGRTNPARPGWLTFKFKLHNAQAQSFQFAPGEVLDTKAPPLSYEYDDVSIPSLPPTVHLGAAAGAPKEEKVPEPQQLSDVPPEMVGATAQGLTLGAEPGETEMPISEPQGPLAKTLAAEPSKVHVYLNVENVTSERPAMNYDVYLNVPDGTDPHERPDLLAGVLAPFGSERAADPEDPHAGAGAHFTFDVTKIVAEQQQAGAWNPEKAHVKFMPRAGEADPVPLHVGRVSLYYHR